MTVLSLALRSLWSRRQTALLTVVAVALSITLLVGVERLRTEARASFANTLSQTDLIVGARSGQVQLLLYSVFRIGNATNNISWSSYQQIAARPEVAWTVPLSLGDSHRGFRVLGTTPDYFEHYRYGRGQALDLREGAVFDDLYDAVLGSTVAAELGYALGEEIVIAHGAGAVSLIDHADKPFRVVGILAPTGTPVDRTVHVSLAGIEAIHLGWMMGTPLPGLAVSADAAREMDLTPKTITAFLVGLHSPVQVFRLQRYVNQYPGEPLLAVLPGVALGELWGLIGVAENALLLVSAFVVVVGLFGLMTALLTSLAERRREMAVLRSVGARPGQVFALIVGEAFALTLAGIVLGLAGLYAGLALAAPLAQAQFGLHLALSPPSAYELGLIGVVLLGSLVLGAVPAYRAYRYSLADGLTIRL